jgi:hypothetical protein
MNLNKGMGRVDRLVNEHIGTQRKSNPHIFFLCFWSSKYIYNPPLNVSIATNNVQFNKRMGKIWGVWCKDVQCLMMGKSN